MKPLAVPLRPSRLLGLVLAGASLGACGLILLLPVAVWQQAVVVAAIVAGVGHAFWRHVWLRAPQSVNALEVNAKGELHCRTSAGDWQPARVLGSSTVTAWLVVLNLKFEGRWLARHVVVLPDMADADALRRLRVWLRWGQAHE